MIGVYILLLIHAGACVYWLLAVIGVFAISITHMHSVKLIQN